MKTPKCPICGTVLQFFHELKFGGLGRVGCSSCEWVTFLASPPQAWKAAEEFISKFPPIMKVCPGDKVKLYEDRHPKKIIGKNADRGSFIWKRLPGRLNPCGMTMWSCGRGRLSRLRRSAKVVIIVNTVSGLAISLLVSNA